MSKPSRKIIEHRYYELSPDFPVLALTGERWRISDLKSEHLHFHNCLEIGICHEGCGTMVFEDKEMPFRTGDVTCIPRHFPHTTYSDHNNISLWSYLFLNLSDFLSDTIQSAEEPSFSPSAPYSFNFLMSKDEYPKLNFLISTIMDEMNNKRNGYHFSVKGLLMALYYELEWIQHTAAVETSQAASAKGVLIIKPALDYIFNNYMNDISIDHLAALCHLSTTHFRRVFLLIMDVTPLSYINSIRISRACILLRTTDAAILSVSERVGFRSVSSFNRYFVQIMGMSPRDYRNPIKNPNVKPEKRSILTFSGWL